MEQFDLFGSTESPVPSAPKVDLEKIPLDAKVPIPRGIYPDVETLARQCNQCQRCDLGQTRTYAVVSRGNPKAKLLIIGEARGANEDETGIPYVGKFFQPNQYPDSQKPHHCSKSSATSPRTVKSRLVNAWARNLSIRMRITEGEVAALRANKAWKSASRVTTTRSSSLAL